VPVVEGFSQAIFWGKDLQEGKYHQKPFTNSLYFNRCSLLARLPAKVGSQASGILIPAGDDNDFGIRTLAIMDL
jgi:hypothetical protein